MKANGWLALIVLCAPLCGAVGLHGAAVAVDRRAVAKPDAGPAEPGPTGRNRQPHRPQPRGGKPDDPQPAGTGRLGRASRRGPQAAGQLQAQDGGVARPIQDGRPRRHAALGCEPPIGRIGPPLPEPELRPGHRHRQARHRRALRQRPGGVEAGRPGDAGRAQPRPAKARGRRFEGHGRGPHGQPAAGGPGGAGAVSRQFPPQHRPRPGRGRPTPPPGAFRAAYRRGGLRAVSTGRPQRRARPAAEESPGREIFVMAPDVPVVGWTDSGPSVY